MGKKLLPRPQSVASKKLYSVITKPEPNTKLDMEYHSRKGISNLKVFTILQLSQKVSYKIQIWQRGSQQEGYYRFKSFGKLTMVKPLNGFMQISYKLRKLLYMNETSWKQFFLAHPHALWVCATNNHTHHPYKYSRAVCKSI